MVRKIIIVLLFISTYGYSQCAMCRATVENNMHVEADDIASSLNFGIMYLLVMPYVAIFTVGILWYYTSKKETNEQNKITSRIRGVLSKMPKG